MSQSNQLPVIQPTHRGADAEPRVTHELIDSRGFGEPIRKALHAILDGADYRTAAHASGLASHQDVYRAAKKLGLAEVYSAQLVAGCRRIVGLTNAELERRLVEDPRSIATKDLAVVTGIDLDKIAKYEGWGSSTRDPGAASAFVDRLSALEGKFKLEVTLERSPSAIDVTPSKTGE